MYSYRLIKLTIDEIKISKTVQQITNVKDKINLLLN